MQIEASDLIMLKNNMFATFESPQAYLKEVGKYPDDYPNVVIAAVMANAVLDYLIHLAEVRDSAQRS